MPRLRAAGIDTQVTSRPVRSVGGKIVEDGTHAELSRAGGEYERLWDRQTGGFLEAE